MLTFFFPGRSDYLRMRLLNLLKPSVDLDN